MEPSAVRLRRAVAVTVAVLVVVFGGLALLFGALVEPGRDLENCSTGLYPGSYADAVIPAHLTAFAALALLAGWLSAQRSQSGRPDRRTLVALGLLSAFALAATAWHHLMDWLALIALLARVPDRRRPVLLLTRPMSSPRRARL